MNQWRPVMFSKRKIVLVICVIGTLVALGTFAGVAAPQKVDKSVPKQQRLIALGEDEVKQLLRLMDADKNGKISRKEFMDFMAAEFDRLDTDKSGELDQKELTQSHIRPSRSAVGK